MVLEGTLVNVAAIIIGTLLGLLFHGIPERIRTLMQQGIGLSVMVMGISMTLNNVNGPGHQYDFLIVIVSLVVGGALGEWLNIEGFLERAGRSAEEKWTWLRGRGQAGQAFLTATLVFCVGAMSILGGLQSGLEDRHDILFTKSLLDGVSSILFTSTMGPGVVLAALPVFVYQGAIALLAGWLHQWLQPPILSMINAAGGLMILGIGVNLLRITAIRVGNLLPALFVAALIRAILILVLGA
nr:DUF554 domain-containing protein [Kyrpidia tusciae]